jgi:outer membrane protein X
MLYPTSNKKREGYSMKKYLILIALFLISINLNAQKKAVPSNKPASSSPTKVSSSSTSVSKAKQKKYKEGDMAIGANLVLGGLGDNYTNIGLGAKFQYNVTDPIRLEGSFTYFFEKDYISMWDLNANVHYLFPVSNEVTVYPLAGLGVLNIGVEIPPILWMPGSRVSNSEVAINFGGGIDYSINRKYTLNGELKYQIVNNWNRLLLSAGLSYRF